MIISKLHDPFLKITDNTEVGYTYFSIEEYEEEIDFMGWQPLSNFKSFETGLKALEVLMICHAKTNLDDEELHIVECQTSSLDSFLGEEVNKYGDPKNYRIHRLNEFEAEIQFKDPSPVIYAEPEELFKETPVSTRINYSVVNPYPDGWCPVGIRLIKKEVKVVSK